MRVLSILALVLVIQGEVQAQNKEKLTRSEAFWGLHFDRHSLLEDKNIGATLTEAMVDSMLKMGRPDYIQIDSKGHNGVSSYPTKVGQQAAGYQKDPLTLIRKVTEKRNVALYLHHSGVIDMNYVSLYPQEARLGPDLKPDSKEVSFWGNYVDSLLIPQLKEMALDYNADGAWIDGEAWAVHPDYNPQAIQDFLAKSGLKTIPTTKEDPGYKELLEFSRRKFVSYIDHYTREVHRVAPDFELCSNWAFSAMMPDPLPSDIQLDFLSGDYDPENSLNSANWHGRCLAGQGKSFDLMAWSFTMPVAPKSAIQLCQEAAAVISLGGGCQVYFLQNQDLSFQPASFPIMKDIADFVLPRREFCHGVSIIPQIGVFYSTAGWKDGVDEAYKPIGVETIRGTMNALLDGQHSVEVLKTHQLLDRIDEFPMIVVPEWGTLEAEAVERLRSYVYNGGRLLVVGASSTKHFDDILGVTPVGAQFRIHESLIQDGLFASISEKYRAVDCLQGTREITRLYKDNDLRYPSGILATTRKYGKGMVAGVYVDLGRSYFTTTAPAIRAFFSNMVNNLAPKLIATVAGTHQVHMVTTEKSGNLLLQLVNTSGHHADVNRKGFDEVPILRDLEINIRTDREPTSVLLQPGSQPVEFHYQAGEIKLSIPELEIHGVVEIRN